MKAAELHRLPDERDVAKRVVGIERRRRLVAPQRLDGGFAQPVGVVTQFAVKVDDPTRLESVAKAIRTLQAAGTDLPHVVVADIAMPDADGYALLDQLRALPGATSRIAVIALTGFGGAEQRARLLDYGFDGFIAKPFSQASLTEVIARIALRGRPQR